MRSNSPVWLAVLGLILAAGVWRLFDLRFAHGDIYPVYSSLRADPSGSRALYDSIAGVPGLQVSRNFRPLDRIAPGSRTVFYLGVSPNNFEYQDADVFEQIEKLASAGARVVIGFRSVQAEKSEGPPPPLRKRWHVGFTYAKHLNLTQPGQTALAFEPADPAWQGNATLLERKYGAGSVLLVARSYPLSNEGLQKERATGLITHMLGGNQRVVFDESHLGGVQSGSIAGLARNYHLEGVAFALLVLAGLYLWKNSVSFLPPFKTDLEPVTQAKDASSGLANLLRRNVPASELIRTCVAQWEHDHAAARYPASKIAQVRAIANRGGDPAALYAEIHRVLTAERTQG